MDGPRLPSEPPTVDRVVSPTVLLHRGWSMWPVLRPLDELDVTPGPLRLGDVIAFPPPDEEHVVAHRLVAIGPEGLQTRGDNCRAKDPWRVDPDRVLGRVTAVVRNGRRRRMLGGLAGQWIAATVRVGSGVRDLLVLVLRPVYHVLAALSPVRLRPRVAVFRRADGPQYGLLLGKRSIGQWRREAGTWAIRAPYRLIVDARSLPPPTGPEKQDA